MNRLSRIDRQLRINVLLLLLLASFNLIQLATCASSGEPAGNTQSSSGQEPQSSTTTIVNSNSNNNSNSNSNSNNNNNNELWPTSADQSASTWPGVGRAMSSLCVSRPALPIWLAAMVVHVRREAAFNYKLYLFSGEHVVQTGQVIPRARFRIHAFPARVKRRTEFWPQAPSSFFAPSTLVAHDETAAGGGDTQTVPVVPVSAFSSNFQVNTTYLVRKDFNQPAKLVRLTIDASVFHVSGEQWLSLAHSTTHASQPTRQAASIEPMSASLPNASSFSDDVSADGALNAEFEFLSHPVLLSPDTRIVAIVQMYEEWIGRQHYTIVYVQRRARAPSPSQSQSQTQTQEAPHPASAREHEHEQHSEIAGANGLTHERLVFRGSSATLLARRASAPHVTAAAFVTERDKLHYWLEFRANNRFVVRAIDWSTRRPFVVYMQDARSSRARVESHPSLNMDIATSLSGGDPTLMNANVSAPSRNNTTNSNRARKLSTTALFDDGEDDDDNEENNHQHQHQDHNARSRLHKTKFQRPAQQRQREEEEVEEEIDNEELMLCPPAVCYATLPIDEIIDYGYVRFDISTINITTTTSTPVGALEGRVVESPTIIDQHINVDNNNNNINQGVIDPNDDFIELSPSYRSLVERMTAPLNDRDASERYVSRLIARAERARYLRRAAANRSSFGSNHNQQVDGSNIGQASHARALQWLPVDTRHLETQLHLRDWYWTTHAAQQLEQASASASASTSTSAAAATGSRSDDRLHDAGWFVYEYTHAQRNPHKGKPDNYGYAVSGHQVDAAFRALNRVYLVCDDTLVTINYTSEHEFTVRRAPLSVEFPALFNVSPSSSSLPSPSHSTSTSSTRSQQQQQQSALNSNGAPPQAAFYDIQSDVVYFVQGPMVSAYNLTNRARLTSHPVRTVDQLLGWSPAQQHQLTPAKTKTSTSASAQTHHPPVDAIYHQLSTDLVFVFSGMRFYAMPMSRFRPGLGFLPAGYRRQWHCINTHLLSGCQFDPWGAFANPCHDTDRDAGHEHNSEQFDREPDRNEPLSRYTSTGVAGNGQPADGQHQHNDHTDCHGHAHTHSNSDPNPNSNSNSNSNDGSQHSQDKQQSTAAIVVPTTPTVAAAGVVLELGLVYVTLIVLVLGCALAVAGATLLVHYFTSSSRGTSQAHTHTHSHSQSGAAGLQSAIGPQQPPRLHLGATHTPSVHNNTMKRTLHSTNHKLVSSQSTFTPYRQFGEPADNVGSDNSLDVTSSAL